MAIKFNYRANQVPRLLAAIQVSNSDGIPQDYTSCSHCMICFGTS